MKMENKKMIKKILFVILSAFIGFVLASCSLAVDREPMVSNSPDEIKNEANLKGYVISFRSYDQGVNFDMGLDSENPFILYEHENISEIESYTEMIRGNAIFTPLIKFNQSDNLKSTEIDSYIILGPKFRNTIMEVQQVLINPNNNELKIESFTYGHMLSDINSGLKISQQSELKENNIVTYLFKYNIEVRFVDELVSVSVIEYSKDNVLLNMTVYDQYGSYDQDTLSETDYIILEEEFRKANGDLYSKRSIHTKGENYTNIVHIPLMFTNEIGYVENNKSIKLLFT